MIKRLAQTSPVIRTAVAVLSFLASLLAFWLLTGNLGIAAVIMGTVALHELCHLIALRSYGIRSGIVFLVILAFTYPVGQDSPEDLLDRMARTFWVLPAGLIGNCLLGLAALALINTWPLAGFVAMINFYLALFNLLPMDISDGGKILRFVTYFSPAKKRINAVQAIVLAEIVGLLSAVYLMNIGRLDGFLGTFVQVFFGMDLLMQGLARWRRVRERLTPRLTEEGAWKWALVYAVLLLIAIAGILLLPTGTSMIP